MPSPLGAARLHEAMTSRPSSRGNSVLENRVVCLYKGLRRSAGVDCALLCAAGSKWLRIDKADGGLCLIGDIRAGLQRLL